MWLRWDREVGAVVRGWRSGSDRDRVGKWEQS